MDSGPEYAPLGCMGRWQRLDVSAVLLITLWTAACAGRIAASPAPGVAGQPRASWIIRAGAEYGAEREICRSDRDQPCRLPASTETQPISVVVSVFLYPAQGAETTYRGAFLSGFMRRHRARGEGGLPD